MTLPGGAALTGPTKKPANEPNTDRLSKMIG